MDIQDTIDRLLVNTEDIKKSYPTVENVRHVIKDIPYAELKAFAASLRKQLNTDLNEKRVFVIYSPFIDGRMDSDIWLYSTVIKIKPAEIIEE